MKHIIRYRPRRADFLATMTDVEAAAVSAHFAYLQDLHAKGTLLLAGRRVDAAYGIAIVAAPTEAAAAALLAADPAVKAGVFDGDVGVFEVALAAERIQV